jgi:putative transcriptional regulator
MIKNNFSRTVGERLLKMKQISEATGISRTTLWSIYNRKCKAISFEVLDKLCKYLNCRIEDIIEYKND